jgi:large subunit ribosomal protein L15
MASILSNLHPPAGAVKTPIRKGRGVGSGIGKTSGKGQKGQKARHPGNFGKLGFQGGQTPIQRRLPKRGFRNPFPTAVAAINIGALSKAFEAGSTIDLDILKSMRLADRTADRLKVLGDGELTHKLTLRVHGISAGARAKVEAAGGTIELLPTTVAKSTGEGSGKP